MSYLWRPDQYQGESDIAVAATQLDSEVSSAAERRRILAEWITFFANGPTPIQRLELTSRVPQELLDSLAGQTQLVELTVKWGPYTNVEALREHRQLQRLSLRGATKLTSLEPLVGLPALIELQVDQAHQLSDPALLGEFTGLVKLAFGNGHPGSDKSLKLPDIAWVKSLTELRSLWLPAVRLDDPDLSPILSLPHLQALRLPLSRQFRKQVFEFAATSPVFAQVAEEYRGLDRMLATMRNQP